MVLKVQRCKRDFDERKITAKQAKRREIWDGRQLPVFSVFSGNVADIPADLADQTQVAGLLLQSGSAPGGLSDGAYKRK